MKFLLGYSSQLLQSAVETPKASDGAEALVKTLLLQLTRLKLLNASIIPLSLRVLPLSFSAPFASALETGVKDPEFLNFTCAGKPETTAQAVSRHRLAASKKKMLQNSSGAPSIPPMGDRARSFAEAFRMCLNRSNADTLDVLKGSQWVCRSQKAPSTAPISGHTRTRACIALPFAWPAGVF